MQIKSQCAECVLLHQRGSFNFSTRKKERLTLITWQKRESLAFCIASCVSFGHTFRNMHSLSPIRRRRNRCARLAKSGIFIIIICACHWETTAVEASFLPSCRSGGDNWFNHHYAWKYLRPIGCAHSSIFVAHSALESRKKWCVW